MSVQTITPRELAEICAKGTEITLIDVRTPMEYRQLHAVIACNVPLDKLNPKAMMQGHDRSEQPLYIICQSGARSQQASEMFIKAGYANIVSVDGGTKAWESAGLPVVRGKKGMSLERQVRIAAGSLVLIGSVLSWYIHPAFIALPAFVGAGLIYAGVTDRCGMGLLLAKMPWNRCKDQTCGCG